MSSSLSAAEDPGLRQPSGQSSGASLWGRNWASKGFAVIGITQMGAALKSDISTWRMWSAETSVSAGKEEGEVPSTAEIPCGPFTKFSLQRHVGSISFRSLHLLLLHTTTRDESCKVASASHTLFHSFRLTLEQE
ncbi:hypothetical protein TNCV_1088581 [Trichonephila clavipes]|uniref:Uncharacterized protein n=1 Tax=Trichonephila clavipes TaxID=2585209 RepID=A0A8X6SX48_TRICX|nr:hypothetical protein TNCV_1088581 [Trichonephila clavipes]